MTWHMFKSLGETPARSLVTAVLIGVAATLAHGQDDGTYRNLDQRECPILDAPFTTLSALEVTYTPPAKSTAEAWEDVAMIDMNAWVRFLYIENDVGGDLEMRASWDSLILQGITDSGSGYPLTTAAIPIRWSQRFLNGWGLQAEVEPGLYSSLQDSIGDDFNVPVGARAIRAFSPELAVFAGLKVYPGFDQAVVPRVGFVWALRDEFVAEFAYPESRVEYRPLDSLRLHAAAGVMNWPEYGMGDDPRERIMYDDAHVRIGLDWGVTEFTEITFQAGYAFDRTISFETGSPDADIEDSPFFGLGIRGRM